MFHEEASILLFQRFFHSFFFHMPFDIDKEEIFPRLSPPRAADLSFVTSRRVRSKRPLSHSKAPTLFFTDNMTEVLSLPVGSGDFWSTRNLVKLLTLSSIRERTTFNPYTLTGKVGRNSGGRHIVRAHLRSPLCTWNLRRRKLGNIRFLVLAFGNCTADGNKWF